MPSPLLQSPTAVSLKPANSRQSSFLESRDLEKPKTQSFASTCSSRLATTFRSSKKRQGGSRVYLRGKTIVRYGQFK